MGSLGAHGVCSGFGRPQLLHTFFLWVLTIWWCQIFTAATFVREGSQRALG